VFLRAHEQERPSGALPRELDRAPAAPHVACMSLEARDRSIPSAQCFNIDGTYLDAADYERVIRKLLACRIDAAVVAIKGKTVCDEVTELRIITRTGDSNGEALLESVAEFFREGKPK